MSYIGWLISAGIYSTVGMIAYELAEGNVESSAIMQEELGSFLSGSARNVNIDATAPSASEKGALIGKGEVYRSFESDEDRGGTSTSAV